MGLRGNAGIPGVFPGARQWHDTRGCRLLTVRPGLQSRLQPSMVTPATVARVTRRGEPIYAQPSRPIITKLQPYVTGVCSQLPSDDATESAVFTKEPRIFPLQSWVFTHIAKLQSNISHVFTNQPLIQPDVSVIFPNKSIILPNEPFVFANITKLQPDIAKL